MFKMDVLGTSRERYPPGVTLAPFSDVFGTFLQKPKATKELTL